MNRSNLLFVLAGTLLLGACAEEDVQISSSVLAPSSESSPSSPPSPSDKGNAVEQGVIRLKLLPPAVHELKLVRHSRGIGSNTRAFNQLFRGVGATRMERLFPYAGKYEERTRREGLHLWYVMRFDSTRSVSEVMAEAQHTHGVEKVEPVPIKQLSSVPYSVPTYHFSDPLFAQQWHYSSDGSIAGVSAGADINLLKAWEIETGKPEVIVNIVDGGVSCTHADLVDNLHVNLAEQNGVEGVDDDDNGYIDDVYGYNFYDNIGAIIDNNPHATHVAGTVAARNNNGIGVCGVAGGDGSTSSGVRLILSQAFKNGRGSTDMSSSARAIKYGADNGAVISQNSWGYANPGAAQHQIYDSDKEAIDYFIKYAGCDNDGQQLPTSPMKGGVVIFAAGNEATEYHCYPAAYEPVVAVAAMGPDFKKASYSNWGDWVDITAPGGDGYGEGRIFSTFLNDQYDYLIGTSMACPHVSGVAALIASHFGGQGFTNDDLKQRLLGALRPYNIDRINPLYAGKLGVGYLDAYQALATNAHQKPATPKFGKITPSFTSALISWKNVSDEDDGSPLWYELYYSQQPLTAANCVSQGKKVRINASGYKAGDLLQHTIEHLELHTPYYLAIQAIDRWGLRSPLAFGKLTTRLNKAPQIHLDSQPSIRICDGQTASLRLQVIEPESQRWTYSVEGDQRGVSFKRQGNDLLFKFNVVEPYGSYRLRVSVKDIYNASSSIEIPFVFYQNHAPEKIQALGTTFVPLSRVVDIDLMQHFRDPEGRPLQFSLKSAPQELADIRLTGSHLSIKGKRKGLLHLTLEVKDERGLQTLHHFKVQVVRDDIVYLLYPIPTRHTLHLRLSNDVQEADITIRNLMGRTVLEEHLRVSSDQQRLFPIDVRQLSGGTYVLEAQSGGKVYKQTFIKQ